MNLTVLGNLMEENWAGRVDAKFLESPSERGWALPVPACRCKGRGQGLVNARNLINSQKGSS